MRSGIFRWLNRLAECPNGLPCIFQSLPSLLQSILKKSRDIFLVIAIKGSGSVVVHCSFKASEEVFVIDDVSVVLVVAIQSIHTADRLEEAVIAHLLVDIEICCRRRIKAGQELVHHDQQLHLAWLFDELLFHFLLEGLNLIRRSFLRLVKPLRKHPSIYVELAQSLCQPFAALFALDLCGIRPIRGNNCAFAFQVRLLEKLVELASLVDASGNQECTPAATA